MEQFTRNTHGCKEKCDTISFLLILAKNFASTTEFITLLTLTLYKKLMEQLTKNTHGRKEKCDRFSAIGTQKISQAPQSS